MSTESSERTESATEANVRARLEAAIAKVKSEQRRRRWLGVGLAASIVGLALLVVGGWAWRQSELRKRSDEIARMVDAAIGEAVRLRAEAVAATPAEAAGIYREALAVTRQAHEIAHSSDGDSGTRTRAATLLADLEREEAGVRARAQVHERDQSMLRRLERIGDLYDEGGDAVATSAEYAAAFGDYFSRGLPSLGAQEAARRIQASAIGEDLIHALEDWLYRVGSADPSSAVPAEVLDAADDDPWRAGLRRATGNRAALVQLTEEADLDALSLVSLVRLSERLGGVGEWERAAKVAAAAWRRAPGDFGACFACARAHAAKTPSDHDAAIRFCTAALAVRPRSFAAQHNLGAALKGKGALEDAIEAYREAIRLEPSRVQAHLGLGITLLEAGRHLDALRQLQSTIRLEPKDALAHYWLGKALLQRGPEDEAIAELRIAIRLQPDLAPAHLALGTALVRKGLLQQAIAAYREVVRLEPQNAGAHYSLGWALGNQGHLDAAVIALREAIRLDPDNANAHTILGIVLARKKRLDDAIGAHRSATQLDPQSAMAHAKLGDALSERGHLDEAIAAYRKAIRLSPQNALAHANLGVVLAKAGQLDSAVAACREATRLDPNLALAHRGLGVALAEKGLLDGALGACREAVRLDPKNARAHHSLGLVLRKKGLTHAAISAFREATRMNPEFTQAHLDLGGELLAQGLHDDALEAYREAIWLDPEHAGAPCRYSAACAAARAGTGQGESSAALDAADRARWRAQALVWLRADLGALREKVAADAALVAQALTHWKQDPDLAGTRDEAEVAKLPADEQEACRKLWTAVDTLLERAKGAVR